MKKLLFLLLAIPLLFCNKNLAPPQSVKITPELSAVQETANGNYYWYLTVKLSQSVKGSTTVYVSWEVLNASGTQTGTVTEMIDIPEGSTIATENTLKAVPSNGKAGNIGVITTSNYTTDANFEYVNGNGNRVTAYSGTTNGTGTGTGSGTGTGGTGTGTGTGGSGTSSGCGYYNGKPLYKGPEGGCYYINSNGNKSYVDRSYCGC